MSATAQSNANFITQITDLADCVGQTPLVKLHRLPEQEQVAKIVVEAMEQAARLSVPLTVDYGVGENWLEAH